MSMSSKGWVIPRDSFLEKATASSAFTFFILSCDLFGVSLDGFKLREV